MHVCLHALDTFRAARHRALFDFPLHRGATPHTSLRRALAAPGRPRIHQPMDRGDSLGPRVSSGALLTHFQTRAPFVGEPSGGNPGLPQHWKEPLPSALASAPDDVGLSFSYDYVEALPTEDRTGGLGGFLPSAGSGALRPRLFDVF